MRHQPAWVNETTRYEKKVVRRKVGNECSSFALILWARPITSFKIFFSLIFIAARLFVLFDGALKNWGNFLCVIFLLATTRACELRIFALKNNVFNQSEGCFQLAAHASRRSPNRKTQSWFRLPPRSAQNLYVWKRHLYGILRIELWTRSRFHLFSLRAQFKQPLSSCDTCA